MIATYDAPADLIAVAPCVTSIVCTCADHAVLDISSLALGLDDGMVIGLGELNDAVNAQAESTPHGYRVRYSLPDQRPLVSLIIPTRNGLKLLKNCVGSIIHRTNYKPLEILIVDNGSDDPETFRTWPSNAD